MKCVECFSAGRVKPDMVRRAGNCHQQRTYPCLSSTLFCKGIACSADISETFHLKIAPEPPRGSYRQAVMTVSLLDFDLFPQFKEPLCGKCLQKWHELQTFRRRTLIDRCARLYQSVCWQLLGDMVIVHWIVELFYSGYFISGIRVKCFTFGMADVLCWYEIMGYTCI